VLRLLLQSVILGLGAYLVIRQELTAGAMIAASSMMGRGSLLSRPPSPVGAPSSGPPSITRLSEALTRAAPKREGHGVAAAGAVSMSSNAWSRRGPKPVVADVRFT
jgi:hypothetical protein